MTSSAQTNRYLVYLPDVPVADACFLNLPEEANVTQLMDAIRLDPQFTQALQSERIFLYKCGDLKETRELFGDALTWIREQSEDKKMKPYQRLKHYFPNGTAPESSGTIDVIVATMSILETAQKPTTPENKTGLEFESTPRKRQSESENLVQDYLGGLEKKFSEFLSGPPWKDFWTAPDSVSPEIAQFINDLLIPKIMDEPVLLLHGLGSGVVDESIVKDLFTNKSTFLVNTSGSGKTRLLYEGLTRHWGFYFTTTVDHSKDLGSVDLMSAISLSIPRSRGFKKKPGELDNRNRTEAYRLNDLIAERRVRQVLTARILVFEFFLKVAQGMNTSRPINEFQKHWLFLQLCSVHILGRDVFARISDLLEDASDEYLMISPIKAHERLLDLQKKICLGENFYFILDEAQNAIEELIGCFRSKNKSVSCPVLRPIINTWSTASSFPIIISGTGLSIDIVNEVTGSAASKTGRFVPVTKTGAFDNRERQLEYIKRYIPPNIAETESGKEFLRRVWIFARGRYHFTAALVAQLLKFSFQSLHRVLNGYVKKITGFCPTDGQQFVNEENQIEVSQIVTLGLDFSKISQNTDLIDFFSTVVYQWLIEQKPDRLVDNTLVELGFARFTHVPAEQVIIDEPLILLAATNQFRQFKRFSLKGYALKGLEDRSSIGRNFELFIAYYLAGAFGNEKKLCDVFEFGNNVPEWANQGADIVSISWEGKDVKANDFHMPHIDSTGFKGSTTVIGRKCDNLEETELWLKSPNSLICFPDNNMGPDLVLFVRLVSNQILAVVIQCKWRSREKLDKDAMKSLITSNFYKNANLKDTKCSEARKHFVEMTGRLNLSNCGINPDGWFQSEVPILKVIASHPDVAQCDRPIHYAFLSMDKCLEAIEGTNLPEALQTFFIKRGAEDKVGRPSKKQRLS